MRALRRWAGLAGAAFVLAAAGAAGLGLVGAVWGWPDALNHFAPVWLCAAWIGGLASRFLLPPGKARARIVIAAALTVLVAGAPVMIEAAKGAGPPLPGPAGLTVLTFNRWWDSPEVPRETAAIRTSGADLVALQEADNFAVAAAGLKDLYPYQLFCDGCDTAILSKRPFLAMGRGRGDFLWVRTTAPDGRAVTLATVHLYWPIPPWVQIRQRARLAADLAALPRDELVLTGDFNLTPWSFAMRSLERSLTPLTRRTHGLMTFPATWPIPILALDQVFAGPQWGSVSIRRLPRAGSDHYPLLVQLRR